MIIGFLGCIIFLMLTGQTFTIGTIEEVPKSFDIPAGNYEIECWPGAVKTHARCVVFDTLNAKAIGRFNSHNVRPMSQKLITENANVRTFAGKTANYFSLQIPCLSSKNH